MSSGSKKVALVTGAARGIGLATATRFLEDGWHVAMLDILGDTLRSAVDALDRADAILALEADVSNASAVRAAVDQTQRRFGRIDALVNNAGVAVFKPMLDVTLEEWQRVLAVNLTGPFLMTQAVAPIMRDHGGGAIVNITSISGLRASTLRVAYGTSKAGLAHSHQTAGGRARRAWHPRQRGGPRPCRHRDGQGRAYARHPRRLSRPHPAQPLWPRGRTRQCDLFSVR
jgi:NAD(P)-dependent dehydrogenase (short-subunit alcohol dehydrogenase family)